MTDIRCAYSSDRDEILVAYLYDDIAPDDRSSFEAHLSACRRCREELDALRGVRGHLSRWAPPHYGVESTVQPRASWWREMPAWAQVAAAMLVLGVSAVVF